MPKPGIAVGAFMLESNGHSPLATREANYIAGARSVIVKSRGHFRAAFYLLPSDVRIVEADVPGLTTPILTRVPYRSVPRPIYPLDPKMTWQP